MAAITNTEECQGVASVSSANKNPCAGDAGSDEPPKEVMNKLQNQLEKVQRDIQIQQRQTQRQTSNRFRSDSRRGSDSERRGSGIGFKLNPRQGGVRLRAIDPATCAPWGHPGDLGVRGQRKGWSGHRFPMLQHPRNNPWYSERMPQPMTQEEPEKFRGCPSPIEPKTSDGGPGQQWDLCSHQQQQLFPPLVNPHAGQRNIFGHPGRALLTCPRPGMNVWQRPVPRHFGPTFIVPQAERPAFNPIGTQGEPSWQRFKAAAPGFQSQGEVHPNIPKGNDQRQANSTETTSEESSSRRDDAGGMSDKNVFGKSLTCDLSEKPASPSNQIAVGSTEKSSPIRKDRSSSGPKTPPGLRQDVSFDFSSILGSNHGWSRLFLADLSLKAPEEPDYGDPFDATAGPDEETPALPQFDTGKETDSSENVAAKTKNDESHGIKITQVSGGNVSIKQRQKTEQGNSMQLIKYENWDPFGSKECVGSWNKRIRICHTPNISKESNIDENNVSCQPNANFQGVSKGAASLLQENDCSKPTQTSHTIESTKPVNTSPPIAFVSPFQHAAYQRKYDRKTPWRRATNLETNSSVNQRDTTCPKCHDRFKWPHLLVCCHRLCFPCLAAMFDGDNLTIQCPYCRSITRTDASLKNLVFDLHKCREMCSLQISPFVCTMCQKNKHADMACRTCPGFLCCDCQLKHRNETELSAHKLEFIQNVGYNQDGELHPMCTEHPGVLYSRFCVDCGTMVCSACLQHSHTGHKSCDLAAGKQISESRFREMNCGLMDMIELCQSKLQNFNLSKQKVEASLKVVRNNVHKACNQMISYIESFEKASKNTADKVHSAGVKHINGLIKEANKYDAERETFEEFCTRYIIDSRPEELTPVLPLLEEQLECLRNFYAHSTLHSPNLSVDLKFDPVYPEFNEAMSRMFAELRFEHNVSLESLLNSPLGDRAVLEIVQPQPYDRVYVPESETGSGTSSSSKEASSRSSEATAGDDMLKNFIRQTTACKYVFGQYGRGDYEFAEPSGICYLHNNYLAVCDAKNHRVMVYDESCNFSTMIGQPANLPPLPASTHPGENEPCFNRTPGALFFPFRLAQCPVTHNLVIVERPPSTDIQVFSCDGTFIRCFGNDCLKYPRGITVNESGQILIVESRTMKVFIFSMDGVKLQAFYLSMHLEFPNDIAAKEGNIFISDNRTHCVHVYDYNLEWQRQIGHESLTYFPIGVAVNHLGHVVVADNHNTFNITVFNQDGSFIHGFKSQSKHANCYSVALHPGRTELAVTTKECKVVLFDYNIASGPQGQGRLLLRWHIHGFSI